MHTHKSNHDPNFVKTSRYGQWNENSNNHNTSARTMTKQDIERHRYNLARAYQCDYKDISMRMERITDIENEDKDKCIILKYMMKCGDENNIRFRDIFSLKIVIPHELKHIIIDEAANKQSAPATDNVQPPKINISTAPRPKPRMPVRTKQ